MPRPGFSRSSTASSVDGELRPSKLSTRWKPGAVEPGTTRAHQPAHEQRAEAAEHAALHALAGHVQRVSEVAGENQRRLITMECLELADHGGRVAEALVHQPPELESGHGEPVELDAPVQVDRDAGMRRREAAVPARPRRALRGGRGRRFVARRCRRCRCSANRPENPAQCRSLREVGSGFPFLRCRFPLGFCISRRSQPATSRFF